MEKTGDGRWVFGYVHYQLYHSTKFTEFLSGYVFLYLSLKVGYSARQSLQIMKIAKEYHKDIFCLEGDWEKDLRLKKSIKSTLDYLQDCFNIRNIHRICAVREQFIKYLKDSMQKKYSRYSILYLAFHGDPNSILFGKDSFTLNEIAEICENKLHNKIVHFGSCNSLDLDKRKLKNFLERTGALCISGYTRKIEFNPSTVLDILYFEMWQDNKDIRSIERKLKKEYMGLIRSTGFRMLYI